MCGAPAPSRREQKRTLAGKVRERAESTYMSISYLTLSQFSAASFICAREILE